MQLGLPNPSVPATPCFVSHTREASVINMGTIKRSGDMYNTYVPSASHNKRDTSSTQRKIVAESREAQQRHLTILQKTIRRRG